MTQDEIRSALHASGLAEITDQGDQDAILAALARLAEASVGMDRVSRALIADAATRILKTLNFDRASRVVDAALAQAPKPTTSQPANKAIGVVPAGEPVDGNELIGALVTAFNRYLWLPKWGALKLALFTIYSHAYECFDVSPLLVITSAGMGSGKTRVIEILEYVVHAPWRNLSASTGALLRQIDSTHPTILYDESDNIDFGARKDLIAILNGGHTRRAATLSMCFGEENVPRQFNIYCPKVFAGNLQFLPETTWSRALVVQMEPRPRDFETLRLTNATAMPLLGALHARVARWVIDNSDALRASQPAVPAGLPDRVADNWTPPLSIADVAGGNWGEQVRYAALESTSGHDEELPEGRELLLNIREVFVKLGVERITSMRLLDELNGNEEWRWKYRAKGGLTPHALGRLLKPFNIRVKTTYFKDLPPSKGYKLETFQRAFAIHLQYIPFAADDDAVTPTHDESAHAGPILTDITVMSNPPTDANDDGEDTDE